MVKKVIDYSKGKVYKIVSSQTDKVYIGSTTKEYLSQRMSKHRENYKSWLTGKQHYISSYDIMEYNDADIILLENVNCKSIDELRARERFYIEQYKDYIVNRYVPGRTIQEAYKEYRKNNLEYIKEYEKK